jgi:hypothetical protein
MKSLWLGGGQSVKDIMACAPDRYRDMGVGEGGSGGGGLIKRRAFRKRMPNSERSGAPPLLESQRSIVAKQTAQRKEAWW